uniref:Protein ECERIFERUM 1-like n=2 Tax=Cannabis sativa TaxID=3483 RepID=A0A803NJC7_CANSA
MASTPGILTEWPWKSLGTFKHVLLVPFAIKSTYNYLTKDSPEERDFSTFMAFPLLLWRMLHNQIWISLSRYINAKGNNRILDRGLEFDQVDREKNWDDQILFNGIWFYVGIFTIDGAQNLPLWRSDGVLITILLHTTFVEFAYYWLHRALHHHYLYNRYHSHHHSSIVTEPITSVIHPFAEHIAYFVLFATPILTTLFTRTASIASIAGYMTYIDFMNNLGHCNFELVPKSLFSIFPPLKYFMYTPSFHSLHHTQFRTNYSLFMPLYDYLYGTMDKSTDSLYETSLKRGEESAQVVYLTHLTTPESIFHLQVGFAHVSSKPYVSPKWYIMMFMWPLTLWSIMITWIYGRPFVVERHRFNRLNVQTWAIPKYKLQYSLQWQNASINSLVEEAILEAEEKGVKVLSLGLLNQSEELNAYGALYVKRHPELKTKVVDGSSLAVAVILNTIPKPTTQVLLRGKITKVASLVALALCHKGIQVATLREDEYTKLKNFLLNVDSKSNLVLTKSTSYQVWLVGDGLSEEEQLKASKGTVFIPFSQFQPKKLRKDCFYHYTPAMLTPKSLENVHSCENWLPRRVMSAWRVAGIVHGLEDWNEHECGVIPTTNNNNNNNNNADFSHFHKVWEAALRHGFQPLNNISST